MKNTCAVWAQANKHWKIPVGSLSVLQKESCSFSGRGRGCIHMQIQSTQGSELSGSLGTILWSSVYFCFLSSNVSLRFSVPGGTVYMSELKTCTTAWRKKNHIHPDVTSKKHMLMFSSQTKSGSVWYSQTTRLSYNTIRHYSESSECVWIPAG